MGPWLRRYAVVVAVPLIALIGWLDYETGPELGLSLLYLVPIAVVGWLSSPWQAIVSAVAAAVCWVLADLGWQTAGVVSVSSWNGFTRLVIYTATALLVHRVRADREELQGLNDELQHALQREQSLARTDATTGLPNSRSFMERITSDVARAARENGSTTLLFLDLDDFKSINDAYGHAIGDVVLTRVAEAIQQQIRAADVAARIGGDEFGVILWHSTAEGATHTRERIANAIEKIAADYPGAHLGASIGIAHMDDARDAETLIRIADGAMYAEKMRKSRG